MKRFLQFLKRHAGFIITLAVVYTLYFTLTGESKVLFDLIIDIMAPIGWGLIGYYIYKWWLRRQNMTFTYYKGADVAYLYLQKRPRKYITPIRAEEVAEGVTFYYRTDTGELWSIEARGVNNVKNETEENEQ
jgi:hypothetical protein